MVTPSVLPKWVMQILEIVDQDAQGFECMCVPIGSGVSGSAIPLRERRGVPSAAGCQSQSGCAHEAVGGHRVINEVEKEADFVSYGGDWGLMNIQDAAINGVIWSISELA